MTALGLALLVGVPLLVLAVVLERKRQSRIYGKPSARPNLAGVGMLELQRHLQADRRVEALVTQVKEEAGETREDGSGEGPEPGEKRRGALPGAPSE